MFGPPGADGTEALSARLVLKDDLLLSCADGLGPGQRSTRVSMAADSSSELGGLKIMKNHRTP